MKNRKSFFAGMLTMALLFSLVVSASAVYANVTKTLSYQDIKVTLNGERLDLRDANGKAVDPFIIDGTTYLPVRAVAESLGLVVVWDGSSKTVNMVGSSTSDLSLLGFYKSLEDGSKNLQNAYSYLGSTDGVNKLKSKTPVRGDGKTFSQTLHQNISTNLQSIEYWYTLCQDKGLSDKNDYAMISEYRRLSSRMLETLDTFSAGASNSFIYQVTGAATQNYSDATQLVLDSASAFWHICNAAMFQ